MFAVETPDGLGIVLYSGTGFFQHWHQPLAKTVQCTGITLTMIRYSIVDSYKIPIPGSTHFSDIDFKWLNTFTP
jgi:hypothetical protein